MEKGVLDAEVIEGSNLRATHQGVLLVGEQKLPCAVLANGKRIISKSAIFRAFGRTKRGRKKDEIRAPNMPSFIDANNLQPFVSSQLKAALQPISYLTKSGKSGTGYPAEILPLLCDVYLIARNEKKLTKNQELLATASESLVRSLSKVGIIALVDEATGYQEIRDRIALQKILAKYLTEEKLEWAKKFPDEFYSEMFRLRNWQWKGMSVNRPQFVGRLTNDIVYERLAPGVLEELKKRTPRDQKGNTKFRFHQWLTDDFGNPKLVQHLYAVVALMKASSNWSQFARSLARAFPKFGDQQEFDLPDS